MNHIAKNMQKLPWNIDHKHVSFFLLACFLIELTVVKWGLEYLLGPEFSDWLILLIKVSDYLIISLLIWVEKYHLDENHIDFWSVTIFYIFGLFLSPTMFSDRLLEYVNCFSGLVFVVILYTQLHKSSIRLTRSYKPFRWLAIGILLPLILLIGLNMAGASPFKGMASSPESPVTFILYYFLYNISYVAIPEETIFRGFLWGSLHRLGLSSKSIWLIQAVIFSIIHYDLYQPERFTMYVSSFLMALFWGLLARKSRSVFPSTISHALMNVLAKIVGN